LTLETLHSFGLAVLVFSVLPAVPAVDAVGLLSCVAVVPALLQLVLVRTHQTDTRVVLVKWAVSLVALTAQVGAVVNFFLTHKELYWQVSRTHRDL